MRLWQKIVLPTLALLVLSTALASILLLRASRDALWEREAAKESSPVLPELERLLVAVGRYANTSSEARYYSDFAHWNLDRARARSLTRWFVPAPESERNFLW